MCILSHETERGNKFIPTQCGSGKEDSPLPPVVSTHNLSWAQDTLQATHRLGSPRTIR